MAMPPLPALKSLDDFLDGSFDYIIIGGGTAGLAVAARLSEDPNVTVGVLEAGQAKLGDQGIMCPAAFPTIVGNKEYDWIFKTVPQHDGVSHHYPRGKCLGGSSAINYMVYVRGQSAEYDDWASLTGYKDWDWKSLKPYFLKSEGLTVPPPEADGDDSATKSKRAFKAEEHGTNGPVKTSFGNWHAPIEDKWYEAGKKLDIGWVVPEDAWSGGHLGGYSGLATIDRSSPPGLRSYSATAYLLPNAGRANLFVLTEALVTKIVLDTSAGGNEPRASGVAFIAGGKEHTVSVKKEVVLSAGTVQTPQVLELSGIGDPDVLKQAGIDCIVPNKNVGESLTDHLMTAVVYDMIESEFSMDHLANPEKMGEAMQQFGTGQGGPLANAVGGLGFLSIEQIATPEEKAQIQAALQELAKQPLSASFEKQEYEILAARLTDPKAASLQLLFLPASVDVTRWDDQAKLLQPQPGKTGCTLAICLTHPFSRGSIHVASSDPAAHPNIDPQYFSRRIDLLILNIGMRVINDWCNTSPFKDSLKNRVHPKSSVDFGQSQNRDEYLLKHTGTEYHPVGTASLGKVVDNELRVKGVQGLRVVDASIVPLQLSGNIQGIVYAIAEKGAEMIAAAS
ncbi:hypothetical protein MMC25_007570 [Agyrium rufum]|nr:hypothetical protein [Agyrium rufum]